MHKYSITSIVSLFTVVMFAGTTNAQTKPDSMGAYLHDTPPGTCWTPDGVATQVKPDDPVLNGAAQIPLPPFVKPDPKYVAEILKFSDQMLTDLSEKSSPKDLEYYQDGVWHFPFTPQNDDWMFGAGPAGLAATLWQYRNEHPETMDAAAKARQPWLRKVAIDTFDTAIKDHLQPNGEYSDLASHKEFFTVDFVTTYLIFKDSLDPDTKARWLNAMKSNIDFMIHSGDLMNQALTGWHATDGWYINGNVDLAKAEYLYLVWEATGDQQYKTLFELQWHHVLLPNQQRWKGYGLFYFKLPTKPDGSDGSGFVAEDNSKPGFDREYSLLQLSIASRLYVESHDPRVLRLINVMINSLLPHVDPDTYVLDALYGSRHSTLDPFCTCAVPTLVWAGGRADLAPMMQDQLEKAIEPPLRMNAEKNIRARESIAATDTIWPRSSRRRGWLKNRIRAAGQFVIDLPVPRFVFCTMVCVARADRD